MLLSNLSNTIEILKTYNLEKNQSFSKITSNSKLADKDTIFIYDKYSKANINYIREALEKKIPAIITNKYYKFISIPQFIVKDIDVVTELLLKKIYTKLPYRTIAVTGTNGKTSVVWYISNILRIINKKNNFVGTLGYYKNGKKIKDVNLTTPVYEDLYKYGSSKNENKNIYIFEASSHALDQNRLRNYPVNIAAITNISKDHLDYHRTMSEYKKTKIKLFTNHLSKKGYAILNSRIKNIIKLEKKLKNNNIKIIYFGKKNINFKKNKKNISLIINKKKYIVNKLKLTTNLELENLECAVACCLALNIKEKLIINTLSKITNPPGRLQEIYYKKKNSKIIIDYAHTPDALKKILQTFKKNKNKPVILFGCGGERDKSKRVLMGIIANKFASRAYITDDNPRNENPSKIRKSILSRCPNGIEIPSRKKAILKAINELNLDETLIIAGKGHEKTQIINNKIIKFDDYKIVKNIINK